MRKSMIDMIARTGPYRVAELPELNRSTDKGLFFSVDREGYDAACQLLDRLDRDLIKMDRSRLAEYLEPRMMRRFEQFVEQCRLNHISIVENKQKSSDAMDFSRRFVATGMFHEREFNRSHDSYEIKLKKKRVDYMLKSREAITFHELHSRFASKYQSREDLRRELCKKTNLDPDRAEVDFLKHHGLLDIDCWIVGLNHSPGFSLVTGDQSAKASFAEDKTTVVRVEKIAMPYPTSYYIADLDYLLSEAHQREFYEEP